MESQRPEQISALSQGLRSGAFFDLSGFKQHQDYIEFSEQQYDVLTSGSSTQLTLRVPVAQDYLNDVEFWFQVDAYNNGALVSVDDTVCEMYKFIRSITIKADS